MSHTIIWQKHGFENISRKRRDSVATLAKATPTNKRTALKGRGFSRAVQRFK